MPVVDIPDVGTVDFPEGMAHEDIARESNRLYLDNQRQAAAKTGARWETVAKVADWADFITRPFASTAENPLGGFASAARPVGQVLNELGDEAVNIYKGVAGSYGLQTGSVDRDVVRGIPPIASAMTGAGTLSRLGLAESLAAPAAFGGVPFAQTLAAGGTGPEAVKAGLVGAAIPGLAEAGHQAVASTLGKLINSGVLKAGSNTGQKVAEALAAQGAIQVFMEGMNLPEYVAMDPEERKAALLHNLAVNSAFLMMDVPGVFSRRGSATSERVAPVAKVGEMMERLVNDPAAADVLARAADDFARDAMDPTVRRRTTLATEPAPVDTTRLESRFVDPALRPFEGQEQRVVEDYADPAPTETVVKAEEFQPRPAQTIEAPTAPPTVKESLTVAEPAPEPLTAKPPQSTVVESPRAAETITGSNEGIASEMPAEREKRLKPVATRSLSDRPWDIIDELEGEVGKIDPALIRKMDPNWQPVGAARKLFRKGGTPADRALNTITYGGPKLGLLQDTPIDQFGHAINRAATARQGEAKAAVKGDKRIHEESKQVEQFERRVLVGERPKAEKSNVERVPVEKLVEGDTFKVQDHEFEVKALEFDDNANLVSLTVKDGPKFGVQTIEPGRSEFIHIDKGTHKPIERDAWMTPDPEAPAPQIKRGQNQGDLLGSGDIDFNLYGEKASDGARIAAERAQAEATRKAAAEFAAKNQPDLAGTGTTEASIERATLPRRIEGDTPGSPDDAPVSLQSIRQMLATALDIPVRVRGFKQRAIGIFKTGPEVIRQKLINDVPTLAHEAGHYLHYILFPAGGQLTGSTRPRASDFARRFDAELLVLGARTSRPSYSQSQVRREGVAEFLREWLTDGAVATARAPGFTAYFEAAIKKDYPEVWKILKTAQKDIRRYLQQPDSAKLDSVISVGDQRPDEPISKLMQRMTDNWINDLGPLERATQQLQSFGLPAAQARAVSDYAVNYIGGWRGKAQSDLFHGQSDINGNIIGPSLQKILGGLDDVQAFRRYVVAKRMLEKAGQGKVVAADQANIIAAARSEVAAGARAHEARRRELLQYQRNARNLLLDAGLLNAQQVGRMDRMNADYVPFHRVQEGVADGTAGSGEGFINLGQGIHAFKGSDRNIIDPLESIVKNTYLFRDLAERNRVGVMFTDALEGTRGGGRLADAIAKRLKPVTVKHDEVVAMLKANGIDTQGLGLEDIDMAFKVWRMAKQSKASEGIFTVWKNGEERPYQLDDPDLFRALSLADATAAKIFGQFPLAPTARLFTRALRAGATLSPEFISRNPIRDQMTAGVYSKHGFIPFWDGIRGLFSAVGKDRWFYDWQKAGGRYSDFVATDRADLQSTLEQVIKEPNALAFAKELANPLNVLRNLQKFSELMEQATRLSEFRLAKQAGASDVQAANASKEVTLNFARGGFKGKALNQLSAFFNASVQDWNKLAREHNFIRDPKRAAQVMSKALLYITVPSVTAWYLGKDDEEIQNLPGWRKNFFWNINLGDLARRAGQESGDFIVSLPKPFLLGQLYGSSVERGLDYGYGKDPNAIKKWVKGVIESTPVHPQNLLPTAIRPAVETVANYSMFRGEPLENQGMQALPPEFRLAPGTSQVARELGQLFPWEYTSPVRLDNLARGYLGGLAKYGSDAIDYALAKSGMVDVPPPVDKTMWELPVLRGFVRSPYEASDYVRRFYDGVEKAEQRIAVLRKGPEFLDSDKLRDWSRPELPALMFYLAPVGKGSMLTELRSAREGLGEIVKAMALVKNNRTMTPEDKAEKLRTLATARDAMAEAAFKMYLAPADKSGVF